MIKEAVDSLSVQHEFRRGRVSELSSLNKQFPVVWMETSPMDTDYPQVTLPIDNWQINLHIAKLDTTDSLPEQYESIIDDCDEVAQQIQFKVNKVVTGYKLLTLEGISRTPFVKVLSSCATGVLLSFTIVAPDQTPQDC